MSETTTVRPLRSRDRAALTPEGDAAILSQALDRFRLAAESEATRKQQVAIGLSKAREAGADIPKPKAKRGSKAGY